MLLQPWQSISIAEDRTQHHTSPPDCLPLQLLHIKLPHTQMPDPAFFFIILSVTLKLSPLPRAPMRITRRHFAIYNVVCATATEGSATSVS